MRHLSLVCPAALLFAAAPACTHAQARTATLRGRVTQAADSALAIGGAEIELIDTKLHRSADKTGRFVLDGVRPGTYLLQVRALGFVPSNRQLVIDTAGVYDASIALIRLPQTLIQVRIEGRTLTAPARFKAIYERAANEHGDFITAEDIDRRNPQDTPALLNDVPTVQVSDRGITFERCQAGLSGMSASPGFPHAPQAAKVQVYIDGTLMTHPGDAGTESDQDVAHALKLVRPGAIQAIEIYTGVSRIPGMFLSDACAVIAIWTKSY